jgi:small-conductance mechanosensitive channel/CRP-like cAMP-binding protein
MIETLGQMQFSWAQVVVGSLAVALALGLGRRPLGPEYQRRVRIVLVALLLSILLHFVGAIVDVLVKGSAERILHGAAVLLLAVGVTGLAGLVLFDLAFHRAGLEVPTILRDILQVFAFFVVLLVVLRRSGVNLLSLVTTSAVLTAVIGLALQNTIANTFAGLSLQLDHTLNVGDWIQMGHTIGRITHIKWRSTFIITRDGNNVILPNSELLKGEVLNYSKPSPVHRTSVQIAIAYRHPPREVARVLVTALRGIPEILPEPAPDCLPLEFGENGVQYIVRYWTDNVQREIIVQGEVRTRLWYAAQRAGFEIPFPQRTVYNVQMGADERARQEKRDRDERLEALARVDLFANLGRSELELLASGVRTQRFASSELIIQQGELGDSLYVVHHGQVVVSIGHDGIQRDVATLKDGDVLGEMSLMTGEPRTATCRAASDVECWVIGHEALRRVLQDNPHVAEDISGILARRQQILDGKRADLSAESGERRSEQRLLARIKDFFRLGE